MRVLALVPSIYDTSPGQRYRLEQWERRLRHLGVDITFAPFEDKDLNAVLYRPGELTRKMWLVSKAFGTRLHFMRNIRHYDAAYVFREAALFGPALFERWVRRAGIPIVFDFDDAIFVPYRSPANGYLSLLKMPGKTRTICRLAAHVIVGNSYLADYARQFNPNVSVVPSTVDTEQYRLDSNRTANTTAVIGWTGSYSTLQHLDSLAPVLRELARKQPFRLRVIGAGSYALPGVEVENIVWKSATEVADLRSIDIGIMPLPENRWTRGKCGMKALQFMGLGIPTICSPIGVNSEIIVDGVNGYLAGTDAQWVEKLTFLLRSPELRNKIGLAGHKTVEQQYSAAVQAPRVYEILSSVVDGVAKPAVQNVVRALKRAV